jgi:hypothetical protein
MSEMMKIKLKCLPLIQKIPSSRKLCNILFLWVRYFILLLDATFSAGEGRKQVCLFYTETKFYYGSKDENDEDTMEETVDGHLTPQG